MSTDPVANDKHSESENPLTNHLADLSTDFKSVALMDYHLHPSSRHDYLFVENPKVASTTILKVLQSAEQDGKNSKLDMAHVHDRGNSPFARLRHLTNEQQDYFLNHDGVYRFAFVRCPYARLLSGYLSKIDRNLEPKRRVLAALKGVSADLITSLDEPITFEEFVDLVCSQETVEMDPHWKPQCAQLLIGRIEYDFIGHFERFDSDFSHVRRHLFGGAGSTLARSRNLTGANAKLQHYFDATTAARVARRFDEDFDMFSYSKALLE